MTEASDVDGDYAEEPMDYSPIRPRCGPWIEQPGGFHKCEKCGRLDPLDFIEDEA
jgi:hypothetical protein